MMTTITKPVYLEEKLEEISSSGRLHYRSKALPTWCPGCGYYAIVEAITTAFNNLGFAAKDTVVVSGIGCASRFPFFINSYGFHTLHGRLLPVATGIRWLTAILPSLQWVAMVPSGSLAILTLSLFPLATRMKALSFIRHCLNPRRPRSLSINAQRKRAFAPVIFAHHWPRSPDLH